MCFLCKKPVRSFCNFDASHFYSYLKTLQWEDQHENLTCEQFATWKQENDPELQAQGLAAYLNEEGIGKKKH